MAKKTCSACGKKGHQAKTCGLTDQERAIRRRKGPGAEKPRSWVKNLSEKLDNVAPPGVEESAPVGDDPFKDLPPVSLPVDAPTAEAEGANGSSTEETKAESSAPEEKTKPASEVFDTSMLQDMAQGLVHDAVMQFGRYAAEHGNFAFGEAVAKLAGKAARVLMRKRAEEMEVDEETGAAYIVFGSVGVNAASAAHAWWMEQRKAKQNVAGAATQPRPAEQQARGPVEQPRARAAQPAQGGLPPSHLGLV